MSALPGTGVRYNITLRLAGRSVLQVAFTSDPRRGRIAIFIPNRGNTVLDFANSLYRDVVDHHP